MRRGRGRTRGGGLRRSAGLLWMGLFLAVGAGAQPARPMLLETAASEALLMEGRTHLLHLRLGEAERTLRRLATRPDGAPAAYFHLAYAAFLKALLTEEPHDLDAFFGRSDTLNTLLDAAPSTPWAMHLRAEDHLHRALAWAKDERYVRAALAGRSAYRHFERVAAAAPGFDEAYLGLGLFHVLIGSLPSSQRKLLRLLGYEGSVRQGLAELRRAAARSRLQRDEATLYLGLADVLLNGSKGGGVEQLAGLHAAYPASPLFAYLNGYALLVNRRADEAAPLLEAAVQAGTQAEHLFIDYAVFYRAQGRFRQGRYAEAEAGYRWYLRRHRGAALKAVAALELGLALEMQGRRTDALAYYRAVESARVFDSDVAARRKARRLLEAPLDPFERALLRATNAYDAGHYAEAGHLLADVLARAEAGSPVHTEALYRRARLIHAEGRHQAALEAYAAVLRAPRPDATARWAPWSQFYIGEIYREQGDDARAAEAYRAALAFRGDYDYHQSLEQQVRVALGQLSHAGE